MAFVEFSAAPATSSTASYPYEAPRSQQLFERAEAVIPGGVNSPVRAFRAVGGTPRFMTTGQGAYLTDADGRRYLDLVSSWGPMVLGHAHPDVVAAVVEAAAAGTSFGTPTRGEVELAEELVARTPVDRVRLVNSGTEATMSALRLARGATGRRVVIKFAGCYHGHVDSLLAAAGSGVATLALPDSEGVTGTQTADTIVLPYNNIVALEQAFAERGTEIAAVITEAAPGNMGVVAPRDGFNAKLREITRAHGALLIMDEVMTGFRVSASGWYGLDPVVPDLATYAKVMGGGLPAAAFGGRADLMDLLAPTGPVYQAGTLSGNPLATAAGLATLRNCTEDLYARLDATSETLRLLVADALLAAGVPHRISNAGNMFSVFFGQRVAEREVTDFETASRTDTAAYRAFFQSMLSAGVYLPPSAYECWFVSGALGDDELALVREALPAAARAAAQAIDHGGDR